MLPYQCISCGRYFPAMLDYYRHRVITPGAARCLTDQEMFAERINTTAAPQPATLATPVQAARSESTPSIAPPLAHARWLLKQGMRPAEIAQKGLPGSTVRKAQALLDAELLAETACPKQPPDDTAPRASLSLAQFAEACRLAYVLSRGQWSHRKIAAQLGVGRSLVPDLIRVGGITHAGLRRQTATELNLLARWSQAKRSGRSADFRQPGELPERRIENGPETC